MNWHGIRISGCVLGLIMADLLGCSQPALYMERYEIANLGVVFLDEQSLKDRWKTVTGTEAVRFVTPMAHGGRAVKTLRGFYDPISKTLYCPKWNFEVCGHELHHAVLGPFHPAD